MELDLRADVVSIFAVEEADMPVWLEVLLNLSGYAGFVVLASRGSAGPQAPADGRICRDPR